MQTKMKAKTTKKKAETGNKKKAGKTRPDGKRGEKTTTNKRKR